MTLHAKARDIGVVVRTAAATRPSPKPVKSEVNTLVNSTAPSPTQSHKNAEASLEPAISLARADHGEPMRGNTRGVFELTQSKPIVVGCDFVAHGV
jgi:hypothetical protein